VSPLWENELASAFISPEGGEDAPEIVDDIPPGDGDKGAPGEPSADPGRGKSDLGELFARKSVAHPTIKALLDRHHPVNTRDLNRELKEFADQLGISITDQ
jgi:hypothetical protein